MRANGYVQKRRSILEHLEDGLLNLTEYLLFDWLILLANSSTGVCKASAERLVMLSGNQMKKRTAQDGLKSLESKGYIKRDLTPGNHGNYWVACDKYLLTTGPNKGKRVSVALSQTAANPLYEDENDRTEENGESPTDTSGSGTGADDLRADGRTEAALTTVLSPRLNNKQDLRKKKTTTGPVVAEAGQAGSETQKDPSTLDVENVIEACFEVAGKNSVHSAKNQAIAAKLLEEHEAPYLLNLLRFARTEQWWKQKFQGASLPVNLFAASVESLSEQATAARPRQVRRIHPVQPKTDTPPSGPCPKCKDTGEFFSERFQAVLACGFCKGTAAAKC